MNVWVMHGTHEGDMFASTHMTEKGAALAAIEDVFEFLDIQDEETALEALNRRYHGETEEYTETPFEWDFEKMKGMKREELWTIFGQWSELTWDNSQGYQIEVNKTRIAG